MRTRSWTDEHDRLLVDAAPSVPETPDAELARVWNRVSVVMVADDKPRRRRGRLVVGAVVAAAVLGTSGVAAAELYSAHTGKGPVDEEDLRLGGPGERLDGAAPDYGQVIAEETGDIPFPSAASRAIAIQDQVSDGEAGVLVAVGAIRAWVADAALCAWSNQWAAATRDGKAADRAEAVKVIAAAPSWPAVTDIDPHPYSRMVTMDVVDEQGVTRTEQFPDESQFFYLAALTRAVQGRDADVVARVLAENNGYCRAELVPDLPAANPMSKGN